MTSRITLAALAAVALAAAEKGTVLTKTGETYVGDVVYYAADSLVLEDTLHRRVSLPSWVVSRVTWTDEQFVAETSHGTALGNTAPVYVIRERNPGEAALYAMVGFPTVIPLGQLYNGEMGKAWAVGGVKLVAVAAAAIGYALSKTYTSKDQGTALMYVGAFMFAGTSIYAVMDAAVSADRINRGVSVGLKVRL